MYECLNLTSGETNAFKQVSHAPFYCSYGNKSYPLPPDQISIQEKDSSTVQTILDEISVFQRLIHKNIVKFYGVEIHHVSAQVCVWACPNLATPPQSDLYMFMELCTEGTVWSIAQQGLPEHMIRHYTRDIVRAVYFLHESGIVHRDIKGRCG